MNIFSKDLDEDCRFKSLSALSCLLRDHPGAQDEFLKIGGCDPVVERLVVNAIIFHYLSTTLHVCKRLLASTVLKSEESVWVSG